MTSREVVSVSASPPPVPCTLAAHVTSLASSIAEAIVDSSKTVFLISS